MQDHTSAGELDLAPYLGRCRVIHCMNCGPLVLPGHIAHALVGIDTPSVDPATSQDLPSHHQLLAHKLCVLENLVLDDVSEGDYELIALPLKLMRADTSPVRAILRELAPHPCPLPKGARA